MLYAIAVLLFGGLFLVNRRVARSGAAPGAVWSALWCGVMLALLLSGNRFFPVHARTLMVYLVGAVAFSLGSWWPGKPAPWPEWDVVLPIGPSKRYIRNLFLACTLILVVSLPAYWHYVWQLASAVPDGGFLFRVRAAMLQLPEQDVGRIPYTVTYVYLTNLPYLSFCVSVLVVSEFAWRRRFRFYALALPLLCVVYTLLTASNGGFATLFGGFFGIYLVRWRELRLKPWITAATCFLAAFSAMGVATGKIGTMSWEAALEAPQRLFDLFLLYALGGVVAFDAPVMDPASVVPNWSVWRFFQLTANKFGAAYAVPSLHAKYTQVAPGVFINVYTAYFAYFPECGYAGVVALLFLAGAAAGYIFRRAAAGSVPWTAAYGLATTAILMSGFSEQFFMSLNFYLKAAALFALAYGFPAWLRCRNQPDFASIRRWSSSPSNILEQP